MFQASIKYSIQLNWQYSALLVMTVAVANDVHCVIKRLIYAESSYMYLIQILWANCGAQ